MAAKCIICKKELPEGSKLPVCEYHKGVAAERVKQVGVGILTVGSLVVVAAKDTVVPVLKDKALPVAKDAIMLVFRR